VPSERGAEGGGSSHAAAPRVCDGDVGRRRAWHREMRGAGRAPPAGAGPREGGRAPGQAPAAESQSAAAVASSMSPASARSSPTPSSSSASSSATHSPSHRSE
jgi:hypothetical protein